MPSSDMGWWLEGSCRDHRPEMFFPDELERNRMRSVEMAAKRICAQCPVVEQCREHALKKPESFGIWGATTPRERRTALLRRGGRQHVIR